jgi:hypothetical protein
VLWVPAGDPWRKEGEEVSGVEHRVERGRRIRWRRWSSSLWNTLAQSWRSC